MVSIGKLNMTELAYSGLGLNPHYGTPLNPNDRATPRSPGGSSSGCGAAVAARLVPCAIGSDTGGSVRIPAAFNGVVGYKTSTGRIDATGLVPLARSYDTIGPLARSVEDCILLDMVMRGAVDTPVRRADLASLTVVAPNNVVLDEAEPAVVENYERIAGGAGARRRRRCGARRVEVLDEILEMTARYGTLTAAEAYNEYREIVDSEQGRRRSTAASSSRIMDGKKMSAQRRAVDPARARAADPRCSAQLAGALLVMPTTPITAPEVAPLEADDEMFHKVNLGRCATPRSATCSTFAAWRPQWPRRAGMPTSFLFRRHGETSGCSRRRTSGRRTRG